MTDRRESPESARMLSDGTVFSILRDSRRRVRLGMASKKAADRLDAATRAVSELVHAIKEDRAARLAMTEAYGRIEGLHERQRLFQRKRDAEDRLTAALAAFEKQD